MATAMEIEKIGHFWVNLEDIGQSILKNKEWLMKFISEIQRGLTVETATRERIARVVYFRGCQLYQRRPEQAATACRIISFALLAAPKQSDYILLSLKKRFEILLALKLYPQALSDYEQIILKDKDVGEHIRKQVLEYHKQPVATAQESRLRLFEQLNVIPKHGLLNINYNIVEASIIPQHIELLRSGIMKTSKAILQGEEIFKEAPFTIYPMEARLNGICNNCGISQFIAISCFKCFGYVVYCSTQCKNQHYNVHQYECTFYQNGMITQFRRCDLLALRMLITGLPTIVHMLPSKKQLHEMWVLILCDLMKPPNVNAYLNVIKMPTYGKMKKDAQKDVRNSARLALYLKHKTDFFKIFKKKVMVGEWETFIGKY